MKYLKYLLYLIILVAVVFFGKGMLTSNVEYESEVTINKPAKEVWAVMQDETKLAGWIEGYLRTEPVSGTPNTVGSVAKVYVDNNGEEMFMEETITAIKPNEHMAMMFTMDFMNMDYEMTLEEKDRKTQVKSKSNIIGNGIFAKSMLSFMPKSMKEQEDKNLNNLKKLAEENTTNYFRLPIQKASQEVVN